VCRLWSPESLTSGTLLGPFVKIDEALLGEKSCPKQLILVAAAADGRMRLAHAEIIDAATLKCFADGRVAYDASNAPPRRACLRSKRWAWTKIKLSRR
jgi:hypothetical protein